MKIILTLILALGVSFIGIAQSADTSRTVVKDLAKSDSLAPTQEQRQYKVDMMSQTQQRDTAKAPNFLEPYKAKRLESNYQYEDGKVTGGSTQLKLGKKKKN